jgi:hypothetical protein
LLLNFFWAAAWNALKIDIVVQLTTPKDYRPFGYRIMTLSGQKVNAVTRKPKKKKGPTKDITLPVGPKSTNAPYMLVM